MLIAIVIAEEIRGLGVSESFGLLNFLLGPQFSGPLYIRSYRQSIMIHFKSLRDAM